MRYAETGFNLEIDLTRGNIERVETDPRETELYLGGLGTNAKILWDRVPPETDPFSPDNLLIFAAGLLCGTPAIGGYWLTPALMYLVSSAFSSGAQSKSGKPCDRLIAPHSAARRDITVKMVVPMAGKRESMWIGVCMLALHSLRSRSTAKKR